MPLPKLEKFEIQNGVITGNGFILVLAGDGAELFVQLINQLIETNTALYKGCVKLIESKTPLMMVQEVRTKTGRRLTVIEGGKGHE